MALLNGGQAISGFVRLVGRHWVELDGKSAEMFDDL